jgi:hypothetical protein
MNWKRVRISVRWFGLALIALGVGLLAQWWLHRNEPPIQNAHFYYGTSQQLYNRSYGVGFIVFGAVMVRTGRWLR